MTQASPHAPRLLALDAGSRRTGVAVSDELGIAAHARPAIHHTTRTELIKAVALIVDAEGVSEVVVGLPLALSGGETAQTGETRELVAELQSALGIPVSTWDERLSSVQAERGARGSAKRKSGELDSAAAAIILQTVLEHRRGFVL